jgi:hypothetical protein
MLSFYPQQVRFALSLEQCADLFNRGSTSLLGCRIGLQENERDALVQLAEQRQGNRVVRFQTSGELVDQSRLTLDQDVLVASEVFEFLHDGTVWFEPPQIVEVAPPGFCQQVRINGIGFGSRGLTATIHGLGVNVSSCWKGLS